MKSQYPIPIAILFMFTACGLNLSGKSDDAFVTSRAKVEANLNNTEKEKLEKSLLVLMGYAMSEKWKKPEKYEGKTFNEIVLGIVDGKTYGELIGFVEDYLEKENEEKKENIKEEIINLRVQRDSIKNMAALLETIHVSDVRIVKKNGDDPKILVKMANSGNLSSIKNYMIGLKVFSISQDKLIYSQGSGGGVAFPKNRTA